ncbi:MAG TPA: TetR/AcrR family transcriptional regulator [Tenuifilaceae bacterium]|nr:TetR/AcrR family transcriptional regulator [Tenuifilaceae bacterium]HPJ46222.1 TetR/AcrR family transcriptional regulator [Tenuifilaceae bacterium]HPQ33844.1 TetR/AcrR family transcriptional regulator [Tenuifilaceae bacterium]HRX67714.1 TetR/AcrR family transcriptional regulator [Tenuifilaceae bacterium]
MSPRTPDQFHEIRETTKQKIVDAALELFAEAGFHTTSISQIASKAGISKGLMYNYFESKEELLKEIVFEGIEYITQSFDPNHDGILTKEELLLFIDESFEQIKIHRNYWKLYFSIMMQAPIMTLFGEELMSKLGSYFLMISAYFQEQKYEDPVAEMRFFSAMLDGIAMNYVMDPEEFPLDAIKQRIIKMYS